MRTFKLVGLTIEQEIDNKKTLKEIPLEDGLVINLEDGENSWLIESLLSKDLHAFFEQLSEADSTVKIFVTISKKSNAPAQIVAKVKTLTSLEHALSVLLEGKLITSRLLHNPEELLRSLMGQGLSGDDLLKVFSESVHQRKDSTKY